MHYVYILKDESDKKYIGYSADLKERLRHHMGGDVQTTRTYNQPVLVWYCAFRDKKIALQFEKYLKAGSGHAFMKKHLLH